MADGCIPALCNNCGARRSISVHQQLGSPEWHKHWIVYNLWHQCYLHGQSVCGAWCGCVYEKPYWGMLWRLAESTTLIAGLNHSCCIVTCIAEYGVYNVSRYAYTSTILNWWCVGPVFPLMQQDMEFMQQLLWLSPGSLYQYLRLFLLFWHGFLGSSHSWALLPISVLVSAHTH